MKSPGLLAAAALGLVLTGANFLPAATPSRGWIENRIQEIQPTAKEKRFDNIGWAADIRTAQALARKHNRPVFLFTHDGRMNLGRC